MLLVVNRLRDISEEGGDLTVRIEQKGSKDELSELAYYWFNSLLINYNR